MHDYLNNLHIYVNAAPAHRNDKNGFVERDWQTMIAMARNWLASAELPAIFFPMLSNVQLKFSITFHKNLTIVHFN